MDKYEYRIKAEQIEKLIGKKDYKTAMKIADTIDWRRVKNINMLYKVSDIYEKNDKHEESKDILLLAYDRAPLGRMIVYKLVELSLKLNEHGEAIEFYREFLQLAPHDPSRYILKYKIQKEMKVSPKELIQVLEEFKGKEYHEEWAYELASLYHQAGMGDKCVEECDELILWFDQGKYVEKAMELKMLYQPLTPAQQEKYDHRNDVVEDKKIVEEIEIQPEEKESPEQVFDPKVEIRIDNIDIQENEDVDDVQDIDDDQDVKSSGNFSLRKIFLNKKLLRAEKDDKISIIEEVTPLKPVSTNKYDTINLQAELAKSVENILESSDDNVLTESLPLKVQESQISLNMEVENELDQQITGQISIEEVLAEMERFKEIKEQEQKEEDVSQEIKEQNDTDNDEKEKAVYETGDIMDILSDVVPQLDGLNQLEVSEPVNSDETIEVFESTNVQETIETPEVTNSDETIETPEVTNSDETKDITGEETKSSMSFEDIEKEIAATTEKFKYSPFTQNQLKNIILHLNNIKLVEEEQNINNIIVTGDSGTGKTTLAIELLKLIHKNRNQKLGKLAKVKGEALNNKEVSKVIKKVEDGVLIIEDAGALSEKSVRDLNQIMDSENTAIVLEDEKKSLELLFCKYDFFAEKFISKINLPGYSNEELVCFGKQYANSKGYEIDEMGVLALYTRIAEIQDDDRTIKLDEIKEILEEAIEYSNKKRIRKLVNKILGRQYSENDLILLREKDFQI